MSSNQMKKNAEDHIPFCKDQGLPNIVGTNVPGVSVQKLSGFAMPSGGVVVFADEGLSDMDISNGTYAVLIQNQSDAADEGTVAEAVKLATQLTIVGPDVADVLDIVIVGTLKGQLS